jgi:hypothetical protein
MAKTIFSVSSDKIALLPEIFHDSTNLKCLSSFLNQHKTSTADEPIANLPPPSPPRHKLWLLLS